MIDALLRPTTYEYDLNNRRTKTIYADNSFDLVGYDAVGRSVSKTDQAGKTTQFTYDDLGRLTKVTDALNQETRYGYNELGQQITQTDANNHITRFEYDQLGRRVKRTLPGGQFETYSYDTSGNLRSRTDFNGKTTTFTHDVMRRLLSKVPDASLSQPTISFTYNATGQRATMSDASGTTVYTYDLRHRLQSKQTPFGTLSYTYDPGGNLATTRSSNANGVSVDYSYDALNRLESVKDNRIVSVNGGVTSYEYDEVGNLESYLYPNGVTTSYNYNSLNRLISMNSAAGVTALSSYNYTLGPAGNRTGVTELSGRTVTYTYDDLYRLTSETIASDPHVVNGTVSYGYDPVGNRLSRASSVAGVPSQTSTYDANDRLSSDSYDNNGNTTSSSSNTYAYDFENRLTSLNNGAATFIYDGDGNRVAKTVGGVTTNYLVDTNNHTGYAQVIEELQGGNVVKQFTYGHDLISQRCVAPSVNCTLAFYGYDGHGSVRQLTDATAAVTDTYTYDAFGILISRTGTMANDYLYSGEQLDANIGFYYLRARYMNSATGRFLTQDIYEGNGRDPLTLHKYLYANADGINNIDPSGTFSIVDVAITLSVFTVVLALSACQSGWVKLPRTVSFVWDLNETEWKNAGGEIPANISASDKENLKLVMYQSFKDAYKGFAVSTTEGDAGYRVRIAYSFGGTGKQCDSGVTGSTTLTSDVYICAALKNARVRGKEVNPNITTPEIIQGAGVGLGRSAAHEFYHQLTGSLASQLHTDDPTDILWGTNAGESPGTIPWDLYYGQQEFKENRKAILKRLIPYE